MDDSPPVTKRIFTIPELQKWLQYTQLEPPPNAISFLRLCKWNLPSDSMGPPCPNIYGDGRCLAIHQRCNLPYTYILGKGDDELRGAFVKNDCKTESSESSLNQIKPPSILFSFLRHCKWNHHHMWWILTVPISTILVDTLLSSVVLYLSPTYRAKVMMNFTNPCEKWLQNGVLEVFTHPVWISISFLRLCNWNNVWGDFWA